MPACRNVGSVNVKKKNRYCMVVCGESVVAKL